MTSKQKQVHAIEFATKYPGWHSFSHDKETVEVLCSLSNLGIIHLNKYSQFKLASSDKAERFIAN